MASSHVGGVKVGRDADFIPRISGKASDSAGGRRGSSFSPFPIASPTTCSIPSQTSFFPTNERRLLHIRQFSCGFARKSSL